MSNDFRYGFLADGKLILVSRDGGESEHTSEFVTGLQQRLQSIKDRSEWKLKGSGAQFMRGGLPVSEGSFEVDHFRAEFSSACFHPADGRLIYGVDAGEVRGLFAHDAKDNLEQRLLHGPARRFGAIDIRHQGEEEEWLLAVMGNDGTSRIGYFTPKKGGGVREVTEGDSIDSYPAWIPGEIRRFVYQTSGVARDRDGSWVALGPASIQMVDLEKGTTRALVEDDQMDYLCPACGPDGELYYLQRPYVPFRKPGLLSLVKDVVFFPVRLIRAIFGFLNVFSTIFTGKPLHTAGLPKREGPDPKAVFLYGRWMNMERMARAKPEDDDEPAVPKTWELRRQRKLNEPGEVLATGVMAYSLAPDGSLYYSDGRGVQVLPAGGGPAQRLSKRRLVSALFAK